MSKGAGYLQERLMSFLSQLSYAEQMHVVTTHPFFTGTCPHCQHKYEHRVKPNAAWDCPECGWRDDALEASKALTNSL
jgi:transposase